jgi:hypothetical protein
VHQNVKAFVTKLLPNVDLVREFNGNFIYLIPISKAQPFKASAIYTQFEKHKDRLYIQDWGLSQSSLEDVFTKICEQDGGNNA